MFFKIPAVCRHCLALLPPIIAKIKSVFKSLEISNNEFKIWERDLVLVRAEMGQQQSSGQAPGMRRKMSFFHLDYICHLKNKSINAR